MKTNRRLPQPRLSWLTVLFLAAQRLREKLAPAPAPRTLALPAPRPPAERLAAEAASGPMTTFASGGAGPVQPQAEPPFWTYFVPNPVIPPRWPRDRSSCTGHDARR